MRSKTKNALLARGLASDLIDKIERHGHTVAVLDAMSKEQLRRFYDSAEVDLIAERIKRQPIPDDVLERVIDAADGACCYCSDGNATRPYEIHHIKEYASTQDNGEDNLLLICPTHHVSVPKQDSTGVQKATRRRWYAEVQVARAYRAKGVQFPFGRFVALDYNSQPFPAMLITRYRLSPSTALALATSPLAESTERQLREHGFSVLLGKSGSGKTTLAVGVAGRLASAGHLVFRYDRPRTGGDNPVGDVLTFLCTADRPCVLLLDDANLDFREPQLAEIQAAAGRFVAILATWGQSDGIDDPRIERQFPGALHVHWEVLRPVVRSFLLANQAEIVAAIQKCQERSVVDRVGLGRMDLSLEDHIRRYEEEAKTISQFLFLLRGGTDAVRQDMLRLIDCDRSDIPVIFAAIEQIAGFERTVSPDEAATACSLPALGGSLPAASAEWVEKVFDWECRRGRMHRRRGEYTTVHREWARRLIGVALGTERSRPDAERLLARDFDCRTPTPLRLMRLWSWLWYDDFGGPFVQRWIGRQPREAWRQLVGTAAAEGLMVLGLVAERLHSTFLRAPHNLVTAEAFASHEKAVATAVVAAGPTDWFSLQHVFRALDHADPAYASRVIRCWDSAKCASVLGETDPAFYNPAWWFFSGVKEHSPDWVRAVGKAVSWEAISHKLGYAPPGHVDDVFHCQSLLVRLGVPPRRNMVRRYGEVIRAVLSDARLSDIRACPLDGMLLNLFFPFEISGALSAMDPRKVADELTIGPPRVWATFTDLTALALNGDSQWPTAVLDAVEPDLLARSVEAQALGNEFELRVLVWGLSRGSESRKLAFAHCLYPIVLAAARRNEIERKDLSTAFFALDAHLGEKLIAEVKAGLDVSALREKQVIRSQRSELLAPIRQQIAERDRTGEDYDLSDLLGPLPD